MDLYCYEYITEDDDDISAYTSDLRCFAGLLSNFTSCGYISDGFMEVALFEQFIANESGTSKHRVHGLAGGDAHTTVDADEKMVHAKVSLRLRGCRKNENR